ncbi:sulfate reduction electron transfer complex DsrMKJOP subunit DsrJ [Calderihabitans maritimus]|uniref:Cytochrome c family protein n=1 Tax=Calderihabitans maritimus TaxID=1246530 RepID=A0A1Z5HQP4_9FIRM|nr:sulfate reduction electron transfer complex DsrMKJOP subunit DsrJ [Calderihabitans maritimus]GAW91758.1 cytochrome c family protein [Calderihabitans maritimus]
MYNARNTVIGLILLIGLVSFPFWYSTGKAASAPQPKLDTPTIQELEEKRCVEATPYMRASHMQLLNEWRTSVIREGNRIYVAENGERYNMSLQNTCMECHSNKTQFCDRCHKYVGVKPDCWTCHIESKENKL